jgi:cation diffusion facilitator CzcD-associated flavoprotein CzcO
MEDTVDKFDLRRHIHPRVECTGAKWSSEKQKWDVHLKDHATGIEFTRAASVFVSAVGAISFPRDVKFPGMEKFHGPMFHTARWDHSVDYTGKRVAVIGNGCSAAQVVPSIASKVAFVKQYARSGQWYHARPNHQFTSSEKAMFRWLPLWQRLLRLQIFLKADEETTTYFPSPEGVKARAAAEEESKRYIKSRTPKKYWDSIIPTFPLGCKRRIFDPDYLDALNLPNVELLNHGIQEITETGIISSGGVKDDFDIIVLATGFQVAKFLTPMDIIGAHSMSLAQQWKECRGAQAYLGTYVHNFPNLAILFGPNTFPANNSALFACETQVNYAIQTLFLPLLDSRAKIIEVKQAAEDRETLAVHQGLQKTVFSGDCSNWYIGDYGRNAASWPGRAISFWWKTCFPDWKAFNMEGGSKLWRLNALKRQLWERSSLISAATVLVFAAPFVAKGSPVDAVSATRELLQI